MHLYQILGYSDDIDIIGRWNRGVEKNFLKIEKAAGIMRLKAITAKAKNMMLASINLYQTLVLIIFKYMDLNRGN